MAGDLHRTQKHWETYSTIRSRPMRDLSQTQAHTGNYYPVSRQPICIHPDIVKLGEEVQQTILVQSAYRYLLDITVLETEIVNRATLYITSNKLPVALSGALRRDALTIIIDEAYHAYVALDCLMQIEQFTGVKPLSFEYDISVEVAINHAKERLPEKMHPAFELIAVCIAENTNTQDILDMIKEKELHGFMKNILTDHYADEARHSVFFEKVLYPNRFKQQVLISENYH